ncbi:MAG TPA: hypothetical protein VJL29_04405 [Thermoguttaceae bacterium]|nr:hypothetical protein [Thermoguttaceae bacterium]
MDEFDAYYQWLGIPPEEQPPDHYRLLGLRRFEDNPTVISHAADRQMAHLRTFQNGPRSVRSQELLNETAAARVCLLNPEKKAAYDERLRVSLAAKRAGQGESAPGETVVDPKLAVLREHVDRKESTAWAQATARRRAAQRRLALACLLLLLAAIAGWFNREVIFSAFSPARPNGRPTPARQGEMPKVAQPPDQSRRENGTKTAPPDDLEHREVKNVPAIRPRPPKREPLPALIVEMPRDVPPAKPAESTPSTPSETNERPEPEVAARRSVPSADERRRIEGILDEVYTFSKIRTPEETDRLIEELLQRGQRAEGTADERFIVLRKAMDVARVAGRMEPMLHAIELLGQRYEVDPWDLKQTALAQWAAEIKDPAAARAFLPGLEAVLQNALDDEHYPTAEQLAKAGSRASLELPDPAVRRKWKESHAEASRLSRRVEKIEVIKQRLVASPDDPADNLEVAEWYCFEREDWRRGLLFLAKTSDTPLGELARRELDHEPAVADERLRLADAWWDLAEKTKKNRREAIHRHAAEWYRRALPDVDGVEKMKIEKRLAELTQEPGKESPKPPRRHVYRCQIAAMADDQFEMYVNGQLLLKGDRAGVVYRQTAMLAHGDVVTVRAVNTGGPRGFVCAIVSFNGGYVVTGPAWRSYGPKSPDTWYLPEQIDRPAHVTAAHQDVAKQFFQQTRVPAASIWGTADISYLFLKVP